MACALTTGFALDCRDSLGGMKNIWVCPVGSATFTGADLITAKTGTFYKYELRRETGSFTETINNSEENGTLFYSQELTVHLSKLESAKRNELVLLAKNDVAVIFEDNNGKYWLAGRVNGLQLGGTASSGTAFGDRSGYELTFSGSEVAPAVEVNSGLVS